MNKMLPLFAGIALLAGVSAANAGEPMLLTTAQMDNVTAGNDHHFTNVAYARAYANAYGDSGDYTFTSTRTYASVGDGYSESSSKSVAKLNTSN